MVRGRSYEIFEHYDIDDNGCWLWKGHLDDGYGRVQVDGVVHMVHRYYYEHFVDDIPEGLEIDHLCLVRNCVNPKHMEPVAPRTNYLRGEGVGAINAAKTHCPQGHPYSEENTYVDKLGKRYCRPCQRRRDRERYWRKKREQV